MGTQRRRRRGERLDAVEPQKPSELSRQTSELDGVLDRRTRRNIEAIQVYRNKSMFIADDDDRRN